MSRRATHDDTENYRDILFSFNPPPLERHSDVELPVASPPLHLLDRHIPEGLILKRLVILPNLSSDLSGSLDAYSHLFDALEPRSTFALGTSFYTQPTSDAEGVFRERNDILGITTSQLASRVVLHPKQPDIWTYLGWDQCSAPHLIDEDYVHQSKALSFFSLDRERFPEEPLSRKTRLLRVKLLEHAPRIIAGMFMCTDAHDVLRDMTILAENPDFPWRCDSDCTNPPSQCIPTPDAPKSLWSLPKHDEPRRSTRVKAHIPKDKRNRYPGIITPRKPPASLFPTYTPAARDYIQKAWISAIHLDTSIIVFDCGNYMRIGVRHRERQTLYLSELVDVRSCKSPAFGRLYAALHVLAVQDALNRLPSLESAAESAQYEPRRRRKIDLLDDTPEVSSKRRMLEKKKDKMTDRDLVTSRCFSSSPVVALSFRFGPYDSPAPTVLWAPQTQRKPAYEPGDYLSLVLDGTMGTGAVGEVFRGRFDSMPSQFKQHPYSPFVVKIADDPGKVERLKHEHRVYVHLNEHGVIGVPTLLGMYANEDATIAILVLTNAGRPLGAKMDSERRVMLQVPQKKQLMRTIKAIHRAGVLHRDIRSWNMMVDEVGQMSIVDFDRGSFHASKTDYKDELNRMEQFLLGEYIDHEGIIGKDDLS